MSKKLKQMVVKELGARYRDIDNCLIVNYKGIKSSQAGELRGYLRDSGIRMSVFRNSIFKFIGEASGNTAVKESRSLLNGPSAIIYPEKQRADVVAFVKTLVAWRDKNKMLEIRGGYIEGKVVLPDDIKTLAAMPSREVLLTQIAGLLNMPMTRLARGLSEVTSKMARALKQYSDKKTE